MIGVMYPFRTPPVIWAAPGAAAQLPDEARRLGATRALLVSDRGLLATGTPERLQRMLEGAGVRCAVYADVMAEPSAEWLDPVSR
ncbi:iron-containing alcohol dehydrogenase [Symbiobacterium thermophilum]|uniref:iron-containing alcohol dehydrogenase n=1 Tax=Symbiobacterium thermophilum TaxID=2734 RepID=UPI0003143DB0|nr:iron-containing alcohol dehydrogenase [Symbiobacterium thermophilum]